MNRIKKIIFWFALVYIGCWVIFPILRHLVNLEFASDSIKSQYQQFQFSAIPIAILLTLFGTVKRTDDRVKVVSTVVKTLGAVLISICISFMTAIGMCGYITTEVLFKSKNESGTRIELREHGCGATDSDPSRVGTYKIERFTKFLVRATPIDTAEIEKGNWIKVE